jgi:hypothetical protein
MGVAVSVLYNSSAPRCRRCLASGHLLYASSLPPLAFSLFGSLLSLHGFDHVEEMGIRGMRGLHCAYPRVHARSCCWFVYLIPLNFYSITDQGWVAHRLSTSRTSSSTSTTAAHPHHQLVWHRQILIAQGMPSCIDVPRLDCTPWSWIVPTTILDVLDTTAAFMALSDPYGYDDTNLCDIVVFFACNTSLINRSCVRQSQGRVPRHQALG